MAYTISERAQLFAPWSISKASIAETCPAQFHHKYVVKTVETTQPSVNRVGTASHSVLEHRLAGKTAAAAKQIALEKTPLTSNELENLRTLESPIEWFLKKWERFCKENQVVEVLLEKEWGITADGEGCGFWDEKVFFRGKVDFSCLTKDNDLLVLDHKSGLAKNIQKDTKFKRQLQSYDILALVNIPGLAGVRSGIHFLQGDEAKRIQWLDYVDAQQIRTTYVPWLYNYLNYCAECLDADFKPKPKLRWPCEFCSYQKTCSAFEDMIRAAQI